MKNLKGTVFQTMVWNEIKKIPKGKTITYKELAIKIGKPKAYRAVANACAKNPLLEIIPCHRVIRDDGKMGGYMGKKGIKRRVFFFNNNITWQSSKSNISKKWIQ